MSSIGYLYHSWYCVFGMGCLLLFIWYWYKLLGMGSSVWGYVVGMMRFVWSVWYGVFVMQYCEVFGMWYMLWCIQYGVSLIRVLVLCVCNGVSYGIFVL